VLLDLRMPGPNGLDLQTALARRGSPLPIVFLTGHGDVTSSVRAMKAGASDFLEKPVKKEALLGAVRAALARDDAQRAEEAERRALRRRFESLSVREREVLEQVVAGRLNKQISAQIGISERTVKAHRASCMVKMGVGSVAELARVAERLGRAQPPERSDSS
jgi:FixJ family two-component response regulator